MMQNPVADDVSIRRATVADYMAFFHGELPSWTAVHNGEVVAMGGFVERSNRCFAYFNVKQGGVSPAVGATVFRAVLRHLRAVKGSVYVTCDALEFPGAERLLRVLGFKPTEEWDNNMRVWLCRA